MGVRPQDLPESRAEVVAYHLTKGPALFDACIRAGAMPIRPPGDIHASAQELARLEAERVRNGELFWVSSDMTELVGAASKTMPGFTLAPDDMPSPWGFMAFEKPIRTITSPYTGEDIPIVAASWGPLPFADFASGGVWASWYSDTGNVLDRAGNSGLPDRVKSMMKGSLPRFTYDCESVAPFSDTELKSVTATGEEPSDNALGVDLLKTVWLLMAQPLAEVSEVEPDRAVRKRMRRANQEPKSVRVIELRRPQRSGEAGPGTREYHHAWVVRGHWRNQWHPKRQVHRPVWIAPHIKGPEGAPLIGGEKVYALKR
ncbi:hypothetical protein ACFZC6_02025 [Streptomyces ossamyceticus]|uniref:hypothetical protein n=1 Tax=Streptomyces ossamyceticus TaxID=249581 RepID=UPI0036E936B4